MVDDHYDDGDSDWHHHDPYHHRNHLCHRRLSSKPVRSQSKLKMVLLVHPHFAQQQKQLTSITAC